MNYMQLCAICFSNYYLIYIKYTYLYIDTTAGILSSCKCLFCYNCLKKLASNSIKNCPVCKSILNFQKCINLRDKNDKEKVKYIFNEPEIEIEKLRQSLKFHENHQNQYIAFLENKIKNLMRENNNLRESLRINAIGRQKNNSNNNNFI